MWYLRYCHTQTIQLLVSLQHSCFKSYLRLFLINIAFLFVLNFNNISCYLIRYVCINFVKLTSYSKLSIQKCSNRLDIFICNWLIHLGYKDTCVLYWWITSDHYWRFDSAKARMWDIERLLSAMPRRQPQLAGFESTPPCPIIFKFKRR